MADWRVEIFALELINNSIPRKTYEVQENVRHFFYFYLESFTHLFCMRAMSMVSTIFLAT